MITLTPELRQAIEQSGGDPIEIKDPETEIAYVLVRAEVFRRMQEIPEGEQSSPNTALLAALEEVEEIQRGMNSTRVSPTQEYLEEARSGAMYGYPGGDEPDPGRD